jgi:hypothetical protein
MKKIFVFVLGLLIFNSAQTEIVKYLRIKINDRSELRSLVDQKLTLLDARVYRNNSPEEKNYRIKWFAENGFVTVADEAGLAEKLTSAGFQILGQGSAESSTFVPAGGKGLPDQFGWPKTMSGWPGLYGQAATVADINGNGKKEIFLNNSEGYVYLWRYNGTFIPGYPKNPFQRFLGIDPQSGDSVFTSWISTGSREGSACGDIDGDGTSEFVFGKDIGYLFAHLYGPYSLPAFPFDLTLATFSSEPAMYDLDNDGKDEIVIMTYLWDSQYPYYPATLHIYNEDGTEMPGWPQQIPVECESSPVIGDIDNDFEMEIVVGSGKDPNNNIPGEIYAFNLDGTVCAGFPIRVGYSVESTPSLADIDLNGIVDILIRIKMESTQINGIYAFNGQGQLLSGFPAVIPRGGSTGAPAVADMDGDGLPDIAYGTAMAVDSGLVWAFNYDGSLKPGFPQLVNHTWVEESVALADVSGDSLPDIVATTNGTASNLAQVWAFDYQGNVVNGFPLTNQEPIGGTLESAPTIADIDGDGDTEIFTGDWDGHVFCWDSPGYATPQNAWPMFKYSAARTGNQFIHTVAIPDKKQPIADRFTVSQNYPNPFNPETHITFTLPSSSEITLTVYNLLGQKVRTLLNHRKYQPGKYQVEFKDLALPSGVYLYRLESDFGVRVHKMLLVR